MKPTSIRTALLAAPALLAALAQADLTDDDRRRTGETLVASGTNAVAYATQIRVSPDDATDLPTHVRQRIAASSTPLLARIAALEARIAALEVPVLALRVAWSDDAAFSAAEFLAGASGDTRDGADVPAYAGGTFARLGVWIAGEGMDALRDIEIAGTIGGLGAYGAAADLTVDGTAGKYVASSRPLLAAALAGRALTVALDRSRL